MTDNVASLTNAYSFLVYNTLVYLEEAHMTFTWLHLLLHLCWFNLQQHIHMYWYIAATAASDLIWASVGSETYLASYCSAVV